MRSRNRQVKVRLNRELNDKLAQARRTSKVKAEQIVRHALWFYFAAKEHAEPFGEKNELMVSVRKPTTETGVCIGTPY